jgi:hypothetical protein
MNSAQDTLAGGLPHSEIPGSTIARISPGLFAACHVLHRLSVPRHPPDALHLRLSATPNGKNHTGQGRSLAQRDTPSRAAKLSEDTSTERTIEGKLPPSDASASVTTRFFTIVHQQNAVRTALLRGPLFPHGKTVFSRRVFAWSFGGRWWR